MARRLNIMVETLKGVCQNIKDGEYWNSLIIKCDGFTSIHRVIEFLEMNNIIKRVREGRTKKIIILDKEKMNFFKNLKTERRFGCYGQKLK